MKLCQPTLPVLVALACAAVTQADTVYYDHPDTNGIESISGTIVQETDSVLQLETESGNMISIPTADVFKIIRDTPSGSTVTHTAPSASYPDLDSGASQSSRIYHAGFKGGMNISNLSVDPQEFEDDDSLRSYALGAWLGIPLNRRLSVQAEALYSVKGDSESAGGYTTTTRMTYIDVPVLAKVGFLHGSPARPSLFLGPSLAMNLSANSTFEGEGNDIDVDVKDDVNAFDLGFVVGGGVEFAVGKRDFGVELRYSKGLSNVAGDGANGTARNDVIALMGSIGLK